MVKEIGEKPREQHCRSQRETGRRRKPFMSAAVER